MSTLPEQVSTRVLTVPNAISAARLSLVPVFAIMALTGRALPAFILLVVIGSTDWVDGFVARKTGQVSVLGKVLDPIADRAAVITVLLVLAFQETVPRVLAAAILLRDVLVSIAFPILEARGVPRIAVNRVGKAATASIFTGVGWAQFGRVLSPSQEFYPHLIALTLLVVGAFLYWVAAAMYVGEIRRQLRSSGAPA